MSAVLSILKAVQFVVIFTLFTLFSCLFAFLIFISYLFTYFSCLFTFCKLFVYISFFENYSHFSCLFTSLLTSFVCLHISAVCLHFFSQLFVHIILFTWTIFRFLNHWLYKVVNLFFLPCPKTPLKQALKKAMKHNALLWGFVQFALQKKLQKSVSLAGSTENEDLRKSQVLLVPLFPHWTN